MAMYTVHKGVRYRAVIALNFWEQVASNDAIKKSWWRSGSPMSR
jgi:hypothetical protein